NALSCHPSPPDFEHAKRPPHFDWTDLTWLLHRARVSWRYYIFKGGQPDCEQDAALTCGSKYQDVGTPGIWNPLPWFGTVRQNRQLANIQSVSRFYAAARTGRLPAVSWVVPNQRVSEHAPSGTISAGQAWVTRLVSSVMT